MASMMMMMTTTRVDASPLNMLGNYKPSSGAYMGRHLNANLDSSSYQVATTCDLRVVVNQGDNCDTILAGLVSGGMIKAGQVTPDDIYLQNAGKYGQFSCDNLPVNSIICIVEDMNNLPGGGSMNPGAIGGGNNNNNSTNSPDAGSSSSGSTASPNPGAAGAVGGNTNITVTGNTNSTTPVTKLPKIILSPYCTKNVTIKDGDTCASVTADSNLVVSELYNTVNLNFPASACSGTIPAGYVGQKLCVDAPLTQHTKGGSNSTSSSSSSSSSASSTSSSATSTTDSSTQPPETSTTQAPPPPPPSSGNSWVDLHNQFRAQYGVGPLSYDGGLSQDATNSLSYYLSSAQPRGCGDIQHDTAYLWANGIGENLYTYGVWGMALSNDDNSHINEAINSWMSEANDWFGHTGGVTGHFTQVVWRATSLVGCGVRYCDNGGSNVMVSCRYRVAGNSGPDPFA